MTSEFAGHLVDLWAYQHKVTLMFSRPGKPTDNAYIESFTRSFKDACLNLHWVLVIAGGTGEERGLDTGVSWESTSQGAQYPAARSVRGVEGRMTCQLRIRGGIGKG